jgi:hypothetical protein
MLNEYEAVVAEQYDVIEDKEQAFFYCKFNYVEEDVRCYTHIYNIIV